MAAWIAPSTTVLTLKWAYPGTLARNLAIWVFEALAVGREFGL